MAFVDSSAYCKMVLHAAKYPHLAVRGLLLGSIQPKPTPSPSASALNGTIEPPTAEGEDAPKETKEVRIVDVVPALHNTLVSPVLETLLIHLDIHCQESGLTVVGVYFCNQRLDDAV